jgi:hypothetical protein
MSSQALPNGSHDRGACGEVDPLYLFACRIQWRQRCNEEAGWELLAALTSSDVSTRMVARSLLRDCR